MEKRTDGLWQGGPWEQPSSACPVPPPVALPSPGRPALRPRRRRRLWPAMAVGAGILLALGMLLFLYLIFTMGSAASGGYEGGQYTKAQEYSTQPPSIPRAQTGTGVTLTLEQPHGEALSYREIYEKNQTCVVSIEAETPGEYSTGTGVVLTADGYIVTNAHVVAGADYVQVVFWDNSVLEASLVGFDADEDLAVLKVDAQNLTPAEFGDSDALNCGDPVAAIGDPLGYRSTITDGIVSALDREVEVDGVTMVLIQTSAAINFGNSGGALINQYGQVVGITTIKIVTDDGSAEGLGFAIPSRRVKYVVDALIDGQEIHTGVFGFTVITRAIPGGGLELQSVSPGSDAYEKGMQAGDIILTANGQDITSTQDLARLKLSLGPGDTVTLTCLRDGEVYTVEVTLVEEDQVDWTGGVQP